jgi:hypothetical protein
MFLSDNRDEFISLAVHRSFDGGATLRAVRDVIELVAP